MTIKITPTLRKALLYVTLGSFAGAVSLGLQHRFDFGQWLMTWALFSLLAVFLFSVGGKAD